MRFLTIGNLYPPHDLGGGYELVWQAANRNLRDLGHEVRVLCSDHREPGRTAEVDPDIHRDLRWYWRDHAFPRHSLLGSARLERHNAATLERNLAEFAPDAVAWWSMGGMSMGLLERVRQRRIGAVAFVHDDWLDYGRRADAWQRRWRPLPGPLRRGVEALAGVPAACDFDRAARYVFVSRRTMDRARAGGLELPDAGIAHSGIDPALLGPAAPNRWSWRLLYVGRVDERKGIRTAVECLAHLPPEASLTIVGGGDPETMRSIRSRAAELGIEERLHLAGRRDPAELPAFYDRADAVLFPVAWEEPWGLVPLEAMARGRPVVATGRGGSADYLGDEENCLLFPAGDAKALAAAVTRLSADEMLRVRLCESGLLTARRHTADVFNDAVAEELAAVAGRFAGPAPRTTAAV